jgi:hypothetical protein
VIRHSPVKGAGAGPDAVAAAVVAAAAAAAAAAGEEEEEEEEGVVAEGGQPWKWSMWSTWRNP